MLHTDFGVKKNGRPKILAHRGALTNAPENTLAAFRLALNNGADGVECDIRRTRDGELVLFHDDDLSRASGTNGRVEESAWKELRGLRVFGREPIAHLQDFLDLMAAHPDKPCYFDLAIRRREDVEDLARRIDAAGMASRSYILTFTNNKRLLSYARAACPEIGLSVMPLIPVRLLETARVAQADSICTGWNQWWFAKKWFLLIAGLTDLRSDVRRTAQAGVEVTGGVANTPEEVRWFRACGMSSIWTDDVPMARKTLDAG